MCLQIRVVNAFQDPAAAPMSYTKGRASFASLVSIAARAEAARAAEGLARVDESKV